MIQHWRQSVKLELCTTASNFNKSGKSFFSEKYRHIVLKCSWKLLSSRPLRNFHTLEVDSKFSPAIFANVFLYAALAFATNEYDFIWTDEENCWKRIYNTQLHHSTAFLRSLSRPYLAFVINISTPGSRLTCHRHLLRIVLSEIGIIQENIPFSVIVTKNQALCFVSTSEYSIEASA